MSVIRRLGDRVEKEHNQFLRDSQRIEDRSATNTNGVTSPASKSGVDFESLVGRANGATVKPDTVIDGDSSKGWDDDVWGTIFSGTPEVTCWYLLTTLMLTVPISHRRVHLQALLFLQSNHQLLYQVRHIHYLRHHGYQRCH